MHHPLRSAEWFAGKEELAFQHRAALRSMGFDPTLYVGKPVIGIANSWSELNNCNSNLRQLVEAVKRGVTAAGGLPLEFSTISLGEEFMKPSAMLYRNLMAMEIEETLRANPIYGVVLLCNCDKTTPAQIMGAASADLRPSNILTEKSFENAIRLLMALGGSTNAVVHLLAMAGRRNLKIDLQRFDDLARTTPWLVNLSPSGKFLMDEFQGAGGVPAVLAELRHLLHTDCLNVNGKTLGDTIQQARNFNPEVIRPRANPLSSEGAISSLFGNLAPRGAIIKTSAASPHLLKHRGRALVFKNYDDMLDRINAPDLPVTPDSVLVLQNAGPKGVPGFPEWGMIPVPQKLLQQGITDIVRISDSRMSGTSFGTVILHVSPEAAAGGPLALVQDGDEISLDVPHRKLEWHVSPEEESKRRAAWTPPATRHLRGYPRLYIDHVLQADEGCDFDFLRPRSEADLQFIPPTVGRS